MFPALLLPILAAGCALETSSESSPLLSLQLSDLDSSLGANGVIATGPRASADPYYHDTLVVEYATTVANLHLVVDNHGDPGADDLRDAVVIVTLNDTKGVFGVDVDRWLLLGELFEPGPAMITELRPLYPDRRYSDYHAFRPLGSLAGDDRAELELTVVASASTKLHLDVVGMRSDGTWGQTVAHTGVTIAIRDDAVAP